MGVQSMLPLRLFDDTRLNFFFRSCQLNSRDMSEFRTFGGVLFVVLFKVVGDTVELSTSDEGGDSLNDMRSLVCGGLVMFGGSAMLILVEAATIDVIW